MMRALFSLLLALALCGHAQAAEPSAEAKQEIAHLLAYLKGSGCEFNRNGSWYGADDAVKHLNQKYAYLLKKGMVATADDFIKLAATESSMSGTPYQVKCGAASPAPSAPWFKAELARSRLARH